MTLAHLTLNSGHLCDSPRAEVSDAAIRHLDPLVARGYGTVALSVPLFVQIDQPHDGCAVISYRRHDASGEVCAVSVLAWDEDAAEEAWADLRYALVERAVSITGSASGSGSIPPLAFPPTVPWLVVYLTASAALLDFDTLMALGDLERCIAWTLLAREGLAP